MPAKLPSLSRFRSAYQRQIALWILRAFSGANRWRFFSRSNGCAATIVKLPELPLALPEPNS